VPEGAPHEAGPDVRGVLTRRTLDEGEEVRSVELERGIRREVVGDETEVARGALPVNLLSVLLSTSMAWNCVSTLP
jgi:hypothetical protein